MFRILVVNPGSTSSKVSLFVDEQETFKSNVGHSPEELSGFTRIAEQYLMRREAVLRALDRAGVSLQDCDAVVGRGGILRPLSSGTYRVGQRMLDELRQPREREHVSNLGALIAFDIASPLGIPAYVVDPVTVDEFDPLARVAGLPDIERRSEAHALNLKAAARRAARAMGLKYEAINLVVVHLGGGISVSAHRQGRMVDVNQGLDGTGPFSPERAGGLPVGDVIRMAYSGRYSEDELRRRITRHGGLYAHLGTNDAQEIEERIRAGDAHAELVYGAMAYQIAKEIGLMAAALGGVQAVVLTGGLAYSEMLVGWVHARVGWIAPLFVFPGEMEMLAMAQGALRVLKGEEEAREY